MSTLTVRLTDSEELDLQWVCTQTGKTKSEVVRELLAESLQAAHAYIPTDMPSCHRCQCANAL